MNPAGTTEAEAKPPTLTRILLSRQASEVLAASGADAFAIVHRVNRTEEPETAGRWAIHLAPVSHARARAACEVLLGRRDLKPLRKSRNPSATR